MDNSEISVVFQGPLVFDKERCLTNSCMNTVRSILPGAEIILSTWKTENIISIEGANFDILVINEDPGTFSILPDSTGSNVNRQIISTLNGLKAATRKYALKMRTDNYLTHAGFKEYFGRYLKRCMEFKILEERVLALAFGTVNPRRCVVLLLVL